MLKGTTCVVTGGAAGIGLATCLLFLKHGANVVVADMDVEGGQRLEASNKDRVIFVGGDVRMKGYFASVLQAAVTKFGRVDVWVNNAGVGFPEIGRENRWRDMVEINLVSLIEGTQIALDHMESKHGGVIIQMASMAGLLPAKLAPIYSATKAGVVHYTRSTAARLGPRSATRVHCVCPVYTDTALVAALGDKVASALAKTQDGKLLQPDDVAQGVLEMVMGIRPGTIGQGPSAHVSEKAPNGSVMRVYVKGGNALRDLYEFPMSLGGRVGRRSKL